MVACDNAFVARRSGASSAEVRTASGVRVAASAGPTARTIPREIVRCRCGHSGSPVPESIALPFRIMVGQTAEFVTSSCRLGSPPASVSAAGQPHYQFLTEGIQNTNAILTTFCDDHHLCFSGLTICQAAE